MKLLRMTVVATLALMLVTTSQSIPRASASDVGVTECGPLDAPGTTYHLTQDIVASLPGNCFTILADNVTLDGDGHTISSDGMLFRRALYSDVIANTEIRNLTITGFANGLQFDNGRGHLIHQTNFASNSVGIDFTNGFPDEPITVTRNVITGNTWGITNSGRFVVIADNRIEHNRHGISLYLGSRGTVVRGNVIRANTVLGIDLDEINLTVSQNRIGQNGIGMMIRHGLTGVVIFNNNLIGNTIQAQFDGDHIPVDTKLNLLPPIGGNYWDDYDSPEEGCEDFNYDGFCDAPYERVRVNPGSLPDVPSSDTDLYPLTIPFATCDGLRATIVGTPGDDIIVGTPGDDVIVGLAGVDDIHGNGGNDTICGGPGNDNLVGQDGDDRLFGNDGNDRIYGLDGADYVEGGDGDDVIYGGNDNDSLHGNAGDDRLKGEAGVDEVHGDEGNDTVQGGDDNDLLYGGPNDDRLYGENGNDTMLGGDGYNVYYGGSGDDTITGGADIDRMKGEAGTDTCDGAGGLADTAQTCEVVLNVP